MSIPHAAKSDRGDAPASTDTGDFEWVNAAGGVAARRHGRDVEEDEEPTRRDRPESDLAEPAGSGRPSPATRPIR